jgi:arylsulfatase A-like enzyme
MDTLRADHVGAYGWPRPTTPNVDRLAARGVMFANAISQSSWTRPAHMSMLTGLYPAEHGFIALADRGRLGTDVPTLASELRRNGYATVAFTGGVNLSPAFGFDRGFDQYRVNGRYFRNNLEEAIYWLEQIGTRKFFLFMHGYEPHTPYHADPIDREALGLSRVPPGKGYRRACKRGSVDRIRRYVDEYDAAVRRGDRYIGKLLSRLDELRLLDRTIVVFTSDHGEEFLEHGRCFHLTTLYREVLHVPLVVAGPGIAPGRVESLVPASVSVPATILDLLGIEGHELPGPSLAAAVLGNEPSFDYVQSETFRRLEGERGEGHLRALTAPQSKLIHWVTRNALRYYDLTTDPLEMAPLETGPALEHMHRSLTAWTGEHPRLPVQNGAAASSVADDTRLEQELRSLGYVD